MSTRTESPPRRSPVMDRILELLSPAGFAAHGPIPPSIPCQNRALGSITQNPLCSVGNTAGCRAGAPPRHASRRALQSRPSAFRIRLHPPQNCRRRQRHFCRPRPKTRRGAASTPNQTQRPTRRIRDLSVKLLKNFQWTLNQNMPFAPL